MSFRVKALRRCRYQKPFHLAIRRGSRGRKLQGDLIDCWPKRFDQIVRQRKCVTPPLVENTECGCKTSSQYSSHQVPTQHRVSIIQARVCANQLTRCRLTPNSPTKSARPIQASRLGLDIAGITRTNLIC
ncbi:hypothetical protein ADJ76_08585 [Schaalia meyeri]|nr:hypothetical protein ADJ76_08585 [Schaalia meyeri]